MEESRLNEFVLRISSLWNEQKIREILYLEALKKDSMGPLRRMLSQGHFSAVLFQKEIHGVYDYFKCFLTDKDLINNQETNLSTVLLMNDIEKKEEVAGFLKKTEGKILQSYQSLYKYLDRDSEIKKVFDEHLDRISEFYEILSRQEIIIVKDMKRPVAA